MRIVSVVKKILLLCVLLVSGGVSSLRAERSHDDAVLIITSYNPETRSMSDNLAAFMDEYKLRGGKHSITIENMNCKNLSEAFLWKDRMASILKKYSGDARPSIVVLLGQEAW